jgi:hypothetical protein
MVKPVPGVSDLFLDLNIEPEVEQSVKRRLAEDAAANLFRSISKTLGADVAGSIFGNLATPMTKKEREALNNYTILMWYEMLGPEKLRVARELAEFNKTAPKI